MKSFSRSSVILTIFLCFLYDSDYVEAACACGASRTHEQEECSVDSGEDDLSVSASELLRLAHKNGLELPPENVFLTVPDKNFSLGTNNPIIPADGEGPAIPVFVSSFKIHRQEVSAYEFLKFVNETNYKTEAEEFGWSFCFHTALSKKQNKEIQMSVEQTPWWVPVDKASWKFPVGIDPTRPRNNILELDLLAHPVIHTSYNDAVAFCSHYGWRLPTEAEFESAAKGKYESIYPWGDNLTPEKRYMANVFQGKFPEKNTAEDKFEFTSPVNSFGPQNSLGIQNIIGNVWEWVEDLWTTRREKRFSMYYDKKIERFHNPRSKGNPDKKDTLGSEERTKKGGSFLCHHSYCFRYRVAARSHNTADSSAQNLGFRCAKDL